MIYIDTSVFLRILLNQPNRLSFKSAVRLVSSELFKMELNRTLDRLRLESKLDDATLGDAKEESKIFLENVELVKLTSGIKQRVNESFPTVVGTLDGLHLATALALREKKYPALKIASHDVQIIRCARTLGFEVLH